jgi:hypothetical protein
MSLISASWVARIIGVSHWCPALVLFHFRLCLAMILAHSLPAYTSQVLGLEMCATTPVFNVFWLCHICY